MLFGVLGIERMKGLRVNRVAGHMLPPIIEGDTPWIGAGVSPEAGQAMPLWLEAEPTTVLLPDRTIGSLHLSVMKNGLTQDQIAVG